MVDCSGVSITNNKVETRTNSGIRDWNTVNLIIKGNSITAQQDGYGGYAGMQIEYSKYFANPNVEICNNIMTKTQGPGIQLIAYDKGLQIKKGISIKQNLFLQTGVSTYIPDTGGISIMGLNGVSIINNVFDGCYNDALYVTGGSATIKNNIITNTALHIRSTVGGYGVYNFYISNLIIDSNGFYNNKKGNLYRITAKNSDFKDPKTHKTTSGWTWKSGKWTL